MAVWSKVQGSPKSQSELKQVSLNYVFQSIVQTCHTVYMYDWRLLGYIQGIFMQGADYDFSKSFRDLEPTRWKCNSVQLLCCLVLNKQVCVYATKVSTHMDLLRTVKRWAEDCYLGKSPPSS